MRWRVRSPGEHALRFPSSSFAPLADAGGIVAFLALASQLPIEELLFKGMTWVQHVHTNPTSLLAMVAALSMIWAFAFARPAPFAGAARPTAMTWARATSISLVGLVLVAATSAFVTNATRDVSTGFNPSLVIDVVLVDPVMIAITVAVILDAIEDFRARRQKLVVAWTLYQPHHADLVKDMLAADGIPAHMSASYLRSLLSFFGPFVPIEVQVPTEHAQATREKLERLAAEA
jgi:hypothetical protein